MRGIEVNHLVKEYDKKEILKDLSFCVPEGKRVSIVGPSGAGKTTLLRILAGLESPTSGTICIDGKQVDKIPPHQRGIAMIFQDAKLFPHTRVKDNITYGMTNLGYSKEEIERKEKEMSSMLQINALRNRIVDTLSAGEKQRVGIARALIREPDYLLLDEPFGNLDAILKELFLQELIAIQEKTNTAMILVSHDQQEAMRFGQQVIVLKDGCIIANDTPGVLYETPPNYDAAQFLCNPHMNEIPLDENERYHQELGLPPISKEENVVAMIRPQHIHITPLGKWKGSVLNSYQDGAIYLVHISFLGLELTVVSETKPNTDEICFDFDTSRILYYEKNTGQRVRQSNTKK